MPKTKETLRYINFIYKNLLYIIMDVHTLHVLLIGPLLIYIGLVKPQVDLLYYILYGLGLYAFFRFFIMLLKQELSQRSAWYVLHVALFSMIAMYVGSKGKHTEQIGYSLLLATGMSAFGYHLVRMFGFH
jgi:hypothetical protein